MVIDLKELKEGEGQFTKQVGPEKLDLSYPDYEFDQPVDVRLQVRFTENQYIIRGSVATTARTRCVRCAENFVTAIDEPINWVVQLIADRKILAEEEATEDYWFIEKDAYSLEIGDRLREILLVNAQANPLCATDCRGLCAQCGKNLNEGDCDCVREETDSRWGPLKELLEKHDDPQKKI